MDFTGNTPVQLLDFSLILLNFRKKPVHPLQSTSKRNPMKNVPLFPVLVLLLVLCVGSTFVALHFRKEVKQLHLNAVEGERAFMELQAEMDGLREANTALHMMLARIRANPMGAGPGGSAAAMNPPTASSGQADAQMGSPSGADSQENENEFIPTGLSPSLPPGTDLSQLPTANPTPSPQLLHMMSQFPEIDPEEVMNQPNMIEEYLKVNPHIREQMNQPQGKYGSGIEEVMRQYPDLAEKVRKAEALAEPQQP